MDSLDVCGRVKPPTWLCVCVFACMHVLGVGLLGIHCGQWGEGTVEGRARWGLPSFPGRALSYGSFSSCNSVNRQWLNGDEKGAGVGRPGQGGGQTRMKIVPPLKLCFGWYLKHISKQHTSLAPLLLLQHIHIYYNDKMCDLLCMHRLQHCIVLYTCLLEPTPTAPRNNKDLIGKQLRFQCKHICSDIVNMQLAYKCQCSNICCVKEL